MACDVMKLCTKFECNRAIRGGVIAISTLHLMTLNMSYVLRSARGWQSCVDPTSPNLAR